MTYSREASHIIIIYNTSNIIVDEKLTNSICVGNIPVLIHKVFSRLFNVYKRIRVKTEQASRDNQYILNGRSR